MRPHMRASRLGHRLSNDLAFAGDTRRLPEPKPTDYPAHDSVKTAAIGGRHRPAGPGQETVLVRHRQEPMSWWKWPFIRNTTLLECRSDRFRAENRRSVGSFFRASRYGNRVAHRKALPLAAVGPMSPPVRRHCGPRNRPGHRPSPDQRGPYESVAVSNYPRPGTPPPPSPEPRRCGRQNPEHGLTAGIAKTTMAGYLFFRSTPASRTPSR